MLVIVHELSLFYHIALDFVLEIEPKHEYAPAYAPVYASELAFVHGLPLARVLALKRAFTLRFIYVLTCCTCTDDV